MQADHSRRKAGLRAVGSGSRDGAPRQECLSQLRQVLSARFDWAGLRTPCLELGVARDDVAAQRLGRTRRESVHFRQHGDRTSDLTRIAGRPRNHLALRRKTSRIPPRNAQSRRSRMATVFLHPLVQSPAADPARLLGCRPCRCAAPSWSTSRTWARARNPGRLRYTAEVPCRSWPTRHTGGIGVRT